MSLVATVVPAVTVDDFGTNNDLPQAGQFTVCRTNSEAAFMCCPQPSQLKEMSIMLTPVAVRGSSQGLRSNCPLATSDSFSLVSMIFRGDVLLLGILTIQNGFPR